MFNLKLICSISTRSVLYSFNRLRRCGYGSATRRNYTQFNSKFYFRFFSGSSVIKNILFNLKLICSISTRSVLYSFNRLRRCGYQSPNYIKIFILPRKIHLFHHFSTKNSYLFHQLDRVNSHLFRLSDYKTATYSVYKRTFLSQWVSFCLFTLVKRLKKRVGH